MAEHLSNATRPSRVSRTSNVPRISNPPRSRASRPSAASGTRPANRRVTPPPERVPWSARIGGWFSARRSLVPRLRRAGYWFAHIAFVVGAMSGVGVMAHMLFGHLGSAPAFSTKHIEIKGATQLGPVEIQRIAGLAVGQNIFKVDAEQAAAKLMAEPWIENAKVQRRLPATYQIQVTERRALALLAAGDLYLVGENGVAFKRLDQGDPADLPLITGLPMAAIEKDKAAASSVLLRAVELLREYSEAGLARREPISEVRIEADENLSAYVGADATYVRLGKAPYRSKLRRLREVFGQLAAQRARAQYVYLDNERRPDRVTVKLR